VSTNKRILIDWMILGVMLCYIMLCILLFVKHLSPDAMQRRSQCDRQVKRKVVDMLKMLSFRFL